jgi:hypothetical protein
MIGRGGGRRVAILGATVMFGLLMGGQTVMAGQTGSSTTLSTKCHTGGTADGSTITCQISANGTTTLVIPSAN